MTRGNTDRLAGHGACGQARLARSGSAGPAAAAPRRSDAGQARFTARDATGLVLVADMYAAPYDLLAVALGVRPDRVRAIAARWRRAGLAETGRIGPGPGWCWLTRAGMRAAGLRFPARRPPLARLAHIRAVLAVRLALEAGEPFRAGSAWWHSERRIRAAARPGSGHVPDSEVHWPNVAASPYADECWAVEAVVGFLIQLMVLRWLARRGLRLLRWLIAIPVMAAAAPATAVALAGYALAWARGWPPAWLRRAAAWCLPMTGAYLTATAITARSVAAAVAAPYQDWLAGWHAVSLGATGRAFVLCAPVAVPAGLLAASWAWSVRIYRIETGLSGRTATAPVIFDQRQWRRQTKTAQARNTAPGAARFTDRRGRIVIGATIRTIGHRWQPVLAIPHTAMGRHQVIIGSSGSGKTNLMIRTWAGWYTATRHAADRGGARPLLVVLDCKGGPDARAKAQRTRALLSVGRCRCSAYEVRRI